MARISLRAVPVVASLAFLSVISPVFSQDPAQPNAGPVAPAAAPASPKLKSHAAEYDKLKGYLLKHLGDASFMEKIAIGFLLMADGGHPAELQSCLEEAKRAKGMVGSSNWSNWFIGFGGIFLAEYYIRFPSDDVQKALEELIERAAPEQEPTGGWFSKTGAAKKANYPATDHGQLTMMVYATMLIMKQHKMKLPAGVFEKTEAYSTTQCGGGGITYGTGNPIGDTTGSRGGFALLGLSYAKRSDHKIYSTYRGLYPQAFGRLDKGHHIGGWHFMGCVLGCWALGADMLGQLRGAVVDKFCAKIDGDGGFYVGDDGASGGEKGLMGHNYCSTAALAMLIVLQDPNAFKIPVKGAEAKKPSTPGSGNSQPTGNSGSPFSQKNMGKPK